MKSHPVIIKIGGNTIPNLGQEFYTFLHQLQMQNRSIIIIHGGGPMISSLVNSFICQWSRKMEFG